MSWYTLPCRVGYPVDDDDEEGQGDGYIGSLLVFVILSSIGLSLSLSHWISIASGKPEVYFSSTMIYAIYIVYMMFANVVMLLLWCGCRSSYVEDLDQSALPELEWTTSINGIPHNCKAVLKSIWHVVETTPDRVVILFFSAFSVVLGVIVIIPTELCLSVYRRCHLETKYAVTLAYHIIRIIFICCLLAFCLKFRSYKMKREKKTRYGLVVIASTTIVIAFVSALHSSYNMPFDNDDNKNLCIDKNNMSLILSQEEASCLYETGPQHNETRTVSHYLYPLHMQFLVMASKTILQLFFGVVSARHFNELVRRAVNGAREYVIINDDNPAQDYQDFQQQPSCFIIIVGSKKFAIPFIILTNGFMLVAYGFADYLYNNVPDDLQYFLMIAGSLYSLLSVGIYMTGFYTLSKMKLKTRSYDGLEMAILFTCGMSVLLYTLTLAGTLTDISFKPPKNDTSFKLESPWSALFKSVLALFTIFLQTSFLMQAARIKYPAEQYSSAFVVSAFYWIVCYLVVHNMALWWTKGLFHIFFSVPLSPVEQEMYGQAHWYIMYHILSPLSLFYFFNCSFMFLSIFLRWFGTVRPTRPIIDDV